MDSIPKLQRNKWDILEAEDIKELSDIMQKYGVEAEKAIDSVLHQEGAEEIKKDIAKLLPASGRRWRGKSAPARSAMPGRFEQDNQMLSVTIAARGRYHYLYFPDDGSNTEHHRGNLRFMMRGAENATNKIIELCLGKLTGG